MVKIESVFGQDNHEKNSNSECQKCIFEIQALMDLINKRRLAEAKVKAAEQEDNNG